MAAAATEEHWAEEQAARLTCLGQADRDMVTTQLQCAGSRAGSDWARWFAYRVFNFVFWSGVVFAALIGVALWAAKIPSRHWPAAATAAAYCFIAIVAAPACHRQARRILIHFRRVSRAASRNFLVLYVSVLGAAALLYSIVNASAFDPGAVRHAFFLVYIREFTAFVVVTALGLVIAYLALAYGYARALQKPGPGQALNWTGMLAATVVTAWLPDTRSPSSATGNRCLDSGLLCTLHCAATIGDLARGQHLADPRTVKAVILALEVAAADIARYAVNRVPRFDSATRRLARRDGANLASVVRNAKAPLASAVHPRSYAAVATALTGFLLAWACSGEAGLTTITDAPAHTGRMPLWRWLASRIWSAALLAAGGVFLPFLPIYNSDHAAAAGLRYALLTAAVLALAADGSPASDIIQRNLESTLPKPS